MVAERFKALFQIQVGAHPEDPGSNPAGGKNLRINIMFSPGVHKLSGICQCLGVAPKCQYNPPSCIFTFLVFSVCDRKDVKTPKRCFEQ